MVGRIFSCQLDICLYIIYIYIYMLIDDDMYVFVIDDVDVDMFVDLLAVCSVGVF